MFWIEFYFDGIVFLYMFCVDIDYFWDEVYIIYGVLGIKIWIYCGEVFLVKKNNEVKGGN